MSPFDEAPKGFTPEQLDNIVIDFGKHKGKTPSQLAEGDRDDVQYVKWAYEKVIRHNRPVFCSEVLYKECGGKFKSAKEQAEAKKAAEVKKPNSYRPATSFDDMDDDIPF